MAWERAKQFYSSCPFPFGLNSPSALKQPLLPELVLGPALLHLLLHSRQALSHRCLSLEQRFTFSYIPLCTAQTPPLLQGIWMPCERDKCHQPESHLSRGHRHLWAQSSWRCHGIKPHPFSGRGVMSSLRATPARSLPLHKALARGGVRGIILQKMGCVKWMPPTRMYYSARTKLNLYTQTPTQIHTSWTQIR